MQIGNLFWDTELSLSVGPAHGNEDRADGACDFAMRLLIPFRLRSPETLAPAALGLASVSPGLPSLGQPTFIRTNPSAKTRPMERRRSLE